MAKNQGGNKKRQRKSRVGSGIRKQLAGQNPGRRAPAWTDMAGQSFVRHEHEYRWPTEDQMNRCVRDFKEITHGKPRDGIKPSRMSFKLFDLAIGTETKNKSMAKLLLCAAMKVKRIKRHPGYRIMKTHSLGNRVLSMV